MDYIKLIRPLLLVLLFGSELLAQSHLNHHSKYWFYRYRMRNEFMVRKYGSPVCGTPTGYMIPASGAYKDDKEDVHFGDGTSMLGNYLAVLTTEYELLKKDNANHTQAQLNDVLQEIYWALKAYERLDNNAEIHLPTFLGKCSDGLNGFFSRDDVPEKMNKEMPSRPNGQDKVIGTSDYMRGHIATIENVTVDEFGDDPNDEKGIFPSADQITNLLVGFAFVKKTLNGVFWNGENLGMLANHYTDKIVGYTNNLGYDMRVPFDGRHTAYAGFFNFGRFGYGIAKAGSRITGSVWGREPVPSGTYDSGLDLIHNEFWNCLNYPSGLIEYNRNYNNSAYNNAIYSQLAAIGSSWEYGLLPNLCSEIYIGAPCISWQTDCHNSCAYCFKWFKRTICNCRNICITYPITTSWDCGYTQKFWNYRLNLPACNGITGGFVWNTIFDNLCVIPVEPAKISYNTTALALSEYGHATNTQIFAMEHKYLHNQGKYTYGTHNVKGYLDSAPYGGPHKYPYNDPHNPENSYGAYGWHVDNRWEKSNPASYENDSQHEGWNGLDYMLLHNLYYLIHGSSNDMKDFRNEMDYVLNDKLWPTATSEGSKASPKTINGFQTITASNTLVSSTSNVTFHAGMNVKLANGFRVKSGADFKAYSEYTFGNYLTNTPNFRTELSQPPSDVDKLDLSGVAEPINDTNAVKALINQEFQKKIDSAVALVQIMQHDNRYVPLSEFVTIPTQALNLPSSQILSVTPNPSSGTFSVSFYLDSNQKISLYLVNSMGIKKLIFTDVLYTEGSQTISHSTTSFPGNYSVLLQGELFSDSKNIIIQ